MAIKTKASDRVRLSDYPKTRWHKPTGAILLCPDITGGCVIHYPARPDTLGQWWHVRQEENWNDYHGEVTISNG